MFGYLITMFAGLFWILRLVVSLMYTTETAFPIIPINATIEIVLLFVNLICIILIAKRKMTGAVIYLIAQGAYFGVDAYKNIAIILNNTPQSSTYLSLLVSIIGVIIPILAIMDIGLHTGKKGSFANKKTDWFYGTTDYDRNFDDRADKNQYKF